jgi:molybdate transport system permease protein
MDGFSWLALAPQEWQAVRLSFVVATRSLVVSLPVAVLLAWLLARGRFLGRSWLDAFVHLPLVLPPVVTGWLLLLLFGVRGPLGSLLQDWFGMRLVFTTNAVVLATVVMSLPLLVRAVRLSLENIDTGLEDAARTLGARPLDRFFTITLPLMAPGILAGAVTAFAAGLGEFGAVITFASNVEGETQTLPLAIYSATQTPGGEATAAKLSLISFVLAVAALLSADRLARRLQRWIGRSA